MPPSTAGDANALPAAYRLPEGFERAEIAPRPPAALFVEATNRCNLGCTMCVRTAMRPEPAATLSLPRFQRIIEQFAAVQRVALHGVGEPLLNPDLPAMVLALKERGCHVLINSNGTLLSPDIAERLVGSGLDEFHCSLDGATRETYARVRGADCFEAVVSGLRALVAARERIGQPSPRLSLWFVATSENLSELPRLIRLAASLEVPEVYVQRLVYFSQEPDRQHGTARREMAVFARQDAEQERLLAECATLSAGLGVALRASGAQAPGASLAGSAEERPWQRCLRPWTSAYVTANGNCLPCCVSPFSTTGYDGLILGNVFEQEFAEIWNGPAYRRFRAAFLSARSPAACAGCGTDWSL